jgi:RNA polymerase sigma-70 factor, ECF subfamily
VILTVLERRGAERDPPAGPPPRERDAEPGDLTAALLVARYHAAVFHYVLRRIQHREDANDITSEVFIAAIDGFGRLKSREPYLWLLGIARRRVAHRLRELAARREIPYSEKTVSEAGVYGPCPSEEAERHERCRMIRSLVDQLTADQREAVLLRYVEELSMVQIAEVMEKKPGAVSSLIQRAQATLYRLGHEYFVDG